MSQSSAQSQECKHKDLLGHNAFSMQRHCSLKFMCQGKGSVSTFNNRFRGNPKEQSTSFDGLSAWLLQTSYKTLSAFPNRDAYVDYIKAALQIGMRVVAVTGERKGDRGAYLGTNGGRPPCNVQWEDFGRSYWVEWHDVEIVGAKTSDGGVPELKVCPCIASYITNA